MFCQKAKGIERLPVSFNSLHGGLFLVFVKRRIRAWSVVVLACGSRFSMCMAFTRCRCWLSLENRQAIEVACMCQVL